MYSSFNSGHVLGAYPVGLSIIFAALMVCLIILKGYSLWSAAKRDEKWWFIALLILNTLGILEIIYIVFFVKQYHKSLSKTCASCKKSCSDCKCGKCDCSKHHQA